MGDGDQPWALTGVHISGTHAAPMAERVLLGCSALSPSSRDHWQLGQLPGGHPDQVIELGRA